MDGNDSQACTSHRIAYFLQVHKRWISQDAAIGMKQSEEDGVDKYENEQRPTYRPDIVRNGM